MSTNDTKSLTSSSVHDLLGVSTSRLWGRIEEDCVRMPAEFSPIQGDVILFDFSLLVDEGA